MATGTSKAPSFEPLLIAVIYGFAAGGVAALVLWAMNRLSDLIWHHDFGSRPFYIFAVIMVGGLLIALLRHRMQGRDTDLAHQVGDAGRSEPSPKDVGFLAAMAIISVAFGGAVGPEAGILAVVAELSALVSFAIVRSKAQQRLIGQVGVAAALGGLYGSPPGAALMPDDSDEAEEAARSSNSNTRPLLFLAGVMGLIGFLFTASWILDGDGMRVQLSAFDSDAILVTMFHSALPAVLGGLAGLLFVAAIGPLQRQLQRLGGVVPQTLIGTAIFASLAAIWPIARFSGHHELLEMSHWAIGAGSLTVLGLALLKIAALTLCLASGWKGGAIFPLLFAGAAAGAIVLPIVPSELATAAFIASMSAAATVGMGKPMAAILVVALLIAPFAAGPLMVGALVGYALSRLGPKPALH